MTMRFVAIPAIATAVVLAGCGTTSDGAAQSASVQSASASGEVASADICPANSPVRGILKGVVDDDDGAFGHVYNKTGGTLWVWSQDGQGPCQLPRDAGASFAGNTADYQELNLDSMAPWRPRGDIDVEESYWVLITSGPERDAPGVAVGINDPYIMQPLARSVYRTASGGICSSDNVMFTSSRLGEDGGYRLKGRSQGNVRVKRLPDNAAIAREWTGLSRTDDWARMDLYVEAIGQC